MDEPEARYAGLEDIAVPRGAPAPAGPSCVSSKPEARKRGMKWMFPESGLRNEMAHRFFEARGYEPVSKVFAQRL